MERVGIIAATAAAAAAAADVATAAVYKSKRRDRIWSKYHDYKQSPCLVSCPVFMAEMSKYTFVSSVFVFCLHLVNCCKLSQNEIEYREL